MNEEVIPTSRVKLDDLTEQCVRKIVGLVPEAEKQRMGLRILIQMLIENIKSARD